VLHGDEPLPDRGHVERVAVERANHLVPAAGDVLHGLRGAADGGDGDSPAQPLGQADDVRGYPGQRRHPAGPDGEAGLDLIEGQQGAVRVQQVAQAGQLPGHGERVPGWLGQVRAGGCLAADGRDDHGMGVPGERRAVAAVHVDVLVAGGVIDPGPDPAADPDRLRGR
jgi:hypothetical protein